MLIFNADFPIYSYIIIINDPDIISDSSIRYCSVFFLIRKKSYVLTFTINILLG